MIRYILIFCFTAMCQLALSQGILSYVKWEADSQGPEKFDRIVIDFTWNQWKTSPPNINQGVFSFGFSSSWFRDIPLGKKVIVPCYRSWV